MFKKYRKTRKYTQEQLAYIIDKDIRTIQRIENKEVIPNLETFAKLVNSLNIKQDDVMKYLKDLSK